MSGGDDYTAGESTADFPNDVEQALRTILPNYAASGTPQTFLRFSRIKEYYVLSFITTQMETRLSFVFFNYCFGTDMADELLSCSWVGLTDKLFELTSMTIHEQQKLLQTYGWKSALDLHDPEPDEICDTIPMGLICGGYLCSQADILAKIRYSIRMEETITELLWLLPPSLRRELSFSGNVSTAGQATGVKLYFCSKKDADAMDNTGNFGGESVDIIMCNNVGSLDNSKRSAQKLLAATQAAEHVSLATWGCMRQLFPENGTWEDLFQILNDISQLEPNFKQLVKKYGAPCIARLVELNLIPDDVLHRINQKYRRIFKTSEVLENAYCGRFPQEKPQPFHPLPSQDKAAPIFVSANQPLFNPDAVDYTQLPPEAPVQGVDYTLSPPDAVKENRVKKARTSKDRATSVQKAQKIRIIKQLLLILLDLVLFVILGVVAAKTLISPISAEAAEQTIVFTMETVHYIQHSALTAILTFLMGILVVRFFHNFRK